MQKKVYILLCGLLFGLNHSFSTANTEAVNSNQDVLIESQSHSDNKIILDLNNVTAEELQLNLDGIGKNKAQKIIEYREKYGPFISVNQLLEVQGIGSSLLEHNRDKLKI